jgi:hypothetical protein
MKKSIIVFATILFSMVVFLCGYAVGGEKFTPDVPDKSKTLPANDGGPDGCNSTRFKCVMGGEAVLDKQTGLTWARNADVANGAKTWKDSVNFCQDLVIGNRKGWRLPTKEEFIAILDTSQSEPALPDGHPFANTKGSVSIYWTGTTYEGNNESAWTVNIYQGRVSDNLKLFDSLIWPVLGGN